MGCGKPVENVYSNFSYILLVLTDDRLTFPQVVVEKL